jgi:hypothetical protein
VSTIPNRTYVTTITVADWRAQGQYGADWNKPVIFTTKFHDGRWSVRQKPDYPDQGPCAGRDTIRGDEVIYVSHPWRKVG